MSPKSLLLAFAKSFVDGVHGHRYEGVSVDDYQLDEQVCLRESQVASVVAAAVSVGLVVGVDEVVELLDESVNAWVVAAPCPGCLAELQDEEPEPHTCGK